MNLDTYSDLISSIGLFYLAYVGVGALNEYYAFLKARYDEKFERIRGYIVLNNIPDVDLAKIVSIVKADIFYNRASEVHPIRIKEIFVKWAIFCTIILLFTGLLKDLPWVEIHMLAYLDIFFIFHIIWRIYLLARPVNKKKIQEFIENETQTHNKYYPFVQINDFENVKNKPKWIRMAYKICMSQLFPKFIGENHAFDIFLRAFLFSIAAVGIMHAGLLFQFDFSLNPGVLRDLTIFVTVILSILAYPVSFLLDFQMVVRLHLHLDKADKIITAIYDGYQNTMDEKVDEILKWLDDSIESLEFTAQ